MKKKFVRVMLFGALTLTVSTVVTSCKDYDDDIKGLQEQVDKICYFVGNGNEYRCQYEHIS